jgi:hypothetical protein
LALSYSPSPFLPLVMTYSCGLSDVRIDCKRKTGLWSFFMPRSEHSVGFITFISQRCAES